MIRELHMSRDSMRKLPALAKDHKCFGAGPANSNGLRMEFYTDDQRVYSTLSIPEYMNSWRGIVHGGIVSTILDEVMFYTAMCFFKCIALTREVTVKLHKPTRLKYMPFTAIGEVKSREDKTNGVLVGKLYDDEGRLCAEASGKFALVESPIIRRLNILSEKDISMVDKIIEQV